jgi:hypothetical protein
MFHLRSGNQVGPESNSAGCCITVRYAMERKVFEKDAETVAPERRDERNAGV